jgi:hypothetical protein
MPKSKRSKKANKPTIHSDFVFEIKEVLRSEATSNPFCNADLMVITWGKAGRPVLEKRRVWVLKTGEKRVRKLVGLNSDDFAFAVENKERINELLKYTEPVVEPVVESVEAAKAE